MNLFSRDLGIDLGSSNVLIYSAGKGIILREPAVIAVDKNNGKVLRVGIWSSTSAAARRTSASFP